MYFNLYIGALIYDLTGNKKKRNEKNSVRMIEAR